MVFEAHFPWEKSAIQHTLRFGTCHRSPDKEESPKKSAQTEEEDDPVVNIHGICNRDNIHNYLPLSLRPTGKLIELHSLI